MRRRRFDRRKKGLATLLVAGALVSGGIAAATSGNPDTAVEYDTAGVTTATPLEHEQDFLLRLNEVRAEAGLTPLLPNTRLAQYARNWSADMAYWSTLRHDETYGAAAAMARTADQIWVRSGENVGVGPDLDAVFAAFTASTPHLENMKGDFSHVGIGVAHVDGDVWVTMRFVEIHNRRSGDGRDSIGIRRNGEWHLRHSTTGGPADVAFRFGDPDGEVIIGDWDGDGVDTVGVRTGKKFELRNSNEAGPADITIYYGREDDEVLVGDWNGDGKDTLAVRRGRTYFFRNDLASGNATTVVTYGRPDDESYAGDWDGDGKDTLVVRRGKVYFFRNDLRSGNAERVMSYGRADDMVVIGDWDGRNGDSIGIRRGDGVYLRNALDSGVADLMFHFGVADDEFFVGDF